MPPRAPDRARFGWTLWGWTRAGSGAGRSRRRGGAYPAQVTREPARGGTLGRVLHGFAKSAIKIVFFSAREGGTEGGERLGRRKAVTHRSAIPLSAPPQTPGYHTTTRVQSWYATRQGAWSRSTTLYSRWSCVITTSTPLWCGFQDQESAESYRYQPAQWSANLEVARTGELLNGETTGLTAAERGVPTDTGCGPFPESFAVIVFQNLKSSRASFEPGSCTSASASFSFPLLNSSRTWSPALSQRRLYARFL